MKRIQRKRTKGWKMPENTVYVGRPTKYGNPFINIQDITYYHSQRRVKSGLDPLVYCCQKSTRDAVELYQEGLNDPLRLGRFIGGYDGAILRKYFERIINDKAELCGKDLSCWCAIDQPCHADILLKFVNDKQP